MKISVIGYSGSGKSTTARQLKDIYNIPVLYLDTVRFISNWEVRNDDEALAIVSKFMEQQSWIIDGNYNSFLQDKRLAQADYIVFLNFPRFLCLWRILKRYFKYRNTSRESMADGCIEKIDLDFIGWVLYKGRTRSKRNHYQEIVTLYKHKTIILKNQKQLGKFINAPPF